MKRFFKLTVAAIMFAAIPLVLPAQEGSPFLTNFSPDDESLTENYSLCLDLNGQLVIANRKGVIIYDGNEWKIEKTPELPLAVALSPGEKDILVGCRNAIGYLNKNQIGEYEYNQIAGSESGLVTQIIIQNSDAYFLSQTTISRVNTTDFKDIKTFKSEVGKPFQHMMLLNNEILVDVMGKGLMVLGKNGLSSKDEKFPLSGKILFNVAYNAKSTLIGASDNFLYIFDGKDVKKFEIQDQSYLSEGTLLDGRLLDDYRVVVSTSAAGCLVFDLKTGKTVFTVNYQTGLPDDEVLALTTDKNQGIWLATYAGLTRVDASIPVKNYTYFKGLEGKPQSIEMFNGKIFIGTSNGLYFLDKKKDYTEYSAKPGSIQTIQPLPKVEAKSVTLSVKESDQLSAKEKKKGLFSRLFSKKEKEEAPKNQASSTGQDEMGDNSKKSSIWNIFRKEKTSIQKVYKIASVTHIYSKVPKFDFKCKQLINFKGHLLAVTISGIYDVTEKEAKVIAKDIEVNSVHPSATDDALFICTTKGLSVVKLKDNKWELSEFTAVKDEPVYSFAKDVFDNYWIGGENKVIKIKFKKDLSVKESKVYNFNSEYRERVIVRLSNKKPVFFMSSGIYSIFNDSIQENTLSKYVSDKWKYYDSQENYTWINSDGNWLCLNADAEPDTIGPNYLNLFSSINHIYLDKNSNLWVIDDLDIMKIDQKGIEKYQTDFNAFIKRLYGKSGESFALNDVKLDRNNNQLNITVSAPYFIKKGSNQYQIFVKGLYSDWGNWQNDPVFNLPLTAGNWEISVRAKNIFGKISQEQQLKVEIAKPFYNTWWFYLICLIAAIGLVYVIIKYRERQLQHEKDVLEQKVVERTKEIAEQKEEIEAQRDKITEINREITDSIRYAKRLQTAVMPDNEMIGAMLSDYFVFFRPKDIVSGDFFWAKKQNDKVIVCAADCTGHGVPGGFLSMLGMSFLNEISAHEKDFKANEILNLLRARVKGTLIKEGHENETKDGMDICLCIIDEKNRKAQYAGANNPLYIIRNKEVLEFSADKMPIGAYLAEKESFTNNEIDLQPNDVLFMFSDGYRDQMGGPLQKRLKSPGFRKLLLDINDKPMKTQKDLIEKFFDEWRGNNEQVDDILVFGVKI
jgi:serine phosphatase RsbU (regulator of sigma subunit)/ligand-binding sensor domain-containing protein